MVWPAGDVEGFSSIAFLTTTDDDVDYPATPPAALQGYRGTCGVDIVLLRCTDTLGQTHFVEFWEVGGSSATRAVRALLYATPFDGELLAPALKFEAQNLNFSHAYVQATDQ